MRALVLLALIASTATAQTYLPRRGSPQTPIGGSQGTRFLEPNWWRLGQSGTTAPLFEFAPSSGAGMGTACAGTTPTGSKGETLTFTRASVATCLKGNTTTGIANGDLVKLSSGRPAVMPGGDGTGPLGLLVEESRTNAMLQSEALDDAAWSGTFSGAAGPVVTPNVAASPDGTTDADRLQVPATTGAQFSFKYQTHAVSAGAETCSLFVKGNGTSGNLDTAMYDTSTWSTAECAYNASTWTRCALTKTLSAGSVEFAFGSLASLTLSGAAFDGFVYGVDCEPGAFATSYIPTTSASVTRAETLAAFGGLSLPAANGPTSLSAKWYTANNSITAVALCAFKSGSSASTYINLQNGANAHILSGGSDRTIPYPSSFTTGSRAGLSDPGTSGASATAYMNGTAGTPTAATGARPAARDSISLNNCGSGFEVDGVVKEVKYDGSLTRGL